MDARSIQPTTIGSKNPRLQRLRRLSGRSKARSEERAFVVDGPVLVADVLRSGLAVEEIFAGPDVLIDDRFISELIPLIPVGVAVYRVEASLLQAGLDPVNPRPLAAVVTTPDRDWDDVDLSRPILVAVEVRDPGNMGTLIRSAEAAGFGGVVVVGESVDPYAPKVVRASAGSIFRTAVIRRSALLEVVDVIGDGGRPVLAAVVDPEALPYDRFDLTSAAIVVGNEPHGLSAEAIGLCDGRFTIPLAPPVESLNVAAAAAVLCFEAARQRRLAAGSHTTVER